MNNGTRERGEPEKQSSRVRTHLLLQPDERRYLEELADGRDLSLSRYVGELIKSEVRSLAEAGLPIPLPVRFSGLLGLATEIIPTVHFDLSSYPKSVAQDFNELKACQLAVTAKRNLGEAVADISEADIIQAVWPMWKHWVSSDKHPTTALAARLAKAMGAKLYGGEPSGKGEPGEPKTDEPGQQERSR